MSVRMSMVRSDSPDARLVAIANSQSTDHDRERAHLRIRTMMNAIMYRGTRAWPTSIRDVSRGGLGLANATSALPGDVVEIHLLTGEVYAGRVRWWCNGHCGVAFNVVIDDTDPIFKHAMRRQRPTLT
jgi:hypothetical protein